MGTVPTLIGCLEIDRADKFLARLKGLLFTKSLPINKALLIIPCNSIHTFGMLYSIHVIFLSKSGVVLKVYKNVKPNRIKLGPRGCESVIEISSDINLDAYQLEGKRFIRKTI